MQRQRSINRSVATVQEVASAPAFQDLLSYQQISPNDSGVTYLYRSSEGEAQGGSATSGDGAPASSARRYDAVSYLQVDWDVLETPGAEVIRSTSAPRGLSNVYLRLLERVERTFGSPIASDLLLLMRASRNGLTIEELVAISGCAVGEVKGLMTELQNHIMSKGGRISLLNDYIGRAIESRYAGPEMVKMAEARERIANYLEGLAFSTRVAEELPWQLLELGALDRLQQCVTASPVAAALCDAGRRGDLYIYWNALQEHVDLRSSYMTVERGKGMHTEEVLALLSRYYSVTSAGGGSTESSEPEIQITHPRMMEGRFVGVLQRVV